MGNDEFRSTHVSIGIQLNRTYFKLPGNIQFNGVRALECISFQRGFLSASSVNKMVASIVAFNEKMLVFSVLNLNSASACSVN